MHLTINFKAEHDERIQKAFEEGDDTLEAQVQKLVLNHVGQQELNKIREAEQKLVDAKMKEIEEEKQKKLNKVAAKLSKELGLV